MLTVYDALTLTNRLPSDQVTALATAAAAVSLAEHHLERSADDANGAHQLWLHARRAKAMSDDDGYQDGSRHTSSREELRYEVVKCGAALMDARREYAAAILAEAEADLQLLCIRFGVGPQGTISRKPTITTEQKETS